MKCINCGNELAENAKFCSACGAPQPKVYGSEQTQRPQYAQPQYQNPVQQPQYGQAQYQSPPQQPQYTQPQYQNPSQQQPSDGNKKLATCALAFAFLMPIVGFILGIIGVCKINDEKLKTQCIISIPLSVVVWIICIIMML